MRRKRFSAVCVSFLFQWKKIYKSALIMTLSLGLVIAACLIVYLLFSAQQNGSSLPTFLDYKALYETSLQNYEATGEKSQLKKANFYLVLLENNLSQSEFYSNSIDVGYNPLEGFPIAVLFIVSPVFAVVFSLYAAYLMYFSKESAEERKNVLQARIDLRDFEKGKLLSYLTFVGLSTLLVLMVSLLVPHREYAVYANEKEGFIRSMNAILWIHIGLSELFSLTLAFIPLLLGRFFKKPLDYALFLTLLCLGLTALLAFGAKSWRGLPFIPYFGDFTIPEEDIFTLIRAIELISAVVLLSFAHLRLQNKAIFKKANNI